MRKLLWIMGVIGLATLSTCLEPELVELPFFTVETLSVESTPLAGGVRLKGVLALNGLEQPDVYGFIYGLDSTWVDSLRDPSLFNIVLTAPYEENVIFTKDTTVAIGATCYTRAFARWGERVVLGQIRQYQARIGLDLPDIDRQNDELFWRVRINGLTNSFDVNEFGVLLSAREGELSLQTADSIRYYGALASDGERWDTLVGATFNTTYQLRPFAIGLDTFYGEQVAFRVRDGWLPMDTLAYGISAASAVVLNDTAYVLGGCKNPTSPCNGNLASINDLVLVFDPDYGEGIGQWSFKAISPEYRGVAEGIAINFQTQVLTGFGWQLEGMTNIVTDYLQLPLADGDSYFYCDSEGPHFASGILFVIGDTLYHGTGIINGEDVNAFWKFNLDNSTSFTCLANETPVASLPLFRNQQDVHEDAGRRGATLLRYGERIFVGFGSNGAYQRNDLYEFIPASSGQPDRWVRFPQENLATRPGPRTNAVSFSIDNRTFFGLGWDGNAGYLNDWWEFCPDEAPPWKRAETMPTRGLDNAFSFAIAPYGYVGGGRTVDTDNNRNLLYPGTWRYYPAID